MKKIILSSIITLSLFSSIFANSIYYVNGYSRSDGTYVSGHYKTTPDAYEWNNLSY